MEEAGKKHSQRKGMKRWKEKKSSRSSSAVDGEEGVQAVVAAAKEARQTPKGHGRSSSGPLSNRTGVVNFSVPPLQFDMPTKKVSSTGKKFRSHKGNAGFKSRCTDQERWHQYLVDEGNFREPTFACPFAFVGRAPKDSTAATTTAAAAAAAESTPGGPTGAGAAPASEEATPAPAGVGVPRLESFEKNPTQREVEGDGEGPLSPERVPSAPSPKGSPKKSKKEYTKRQPSLLREMCLYAPRTLSMLSDNVAVVNNVVQYQSLEQFGVKKFNLAEMTEWEAAIRESIERHFLEKDKGRSLKNKVRDKSLGVINSTPRSRSRSRATSDADRKSPNKPGTPQKGGVSSKEIQYGGLRTSINPLLLLDGQERSRSLTHKPRQRMKRASTALERPIDFSKSPAGSDADESTNSLSDSSSHAASAPPSPTREEPPPVRNISVADKKERRSIIHLISGGRSPRRGTEDGDSTALPRRSSSAKNPTPLGNLPMISPSSTSKLEALLGANMLEQQHFIPVGAGQSLSAVSPAEAMRSEEDEASVAKSISPLRLFSPRKKGKRQPLTSSGGSEESSSPATTPKGDQGKKKRPGYFQSLKMQLKTPRGTKKDDEESQAHPRKRKSRTPKTKKPKDLVIQRIDPATGSPPKLAPSTGSRPASPLRDPPSPDGDVQAELDDCLAPSPHGPRHHSACFDRSADGLGTGMVDALVDSRVLPNASHRLSLPVRRTQSRTKSSKSDTEAGLLRSPGGVRFEEEELNPPSDRDED